MTRPRNEGDTMTDYEDVREMARRVYEQAASGKYGAVGPGSGATGNRAVVWKRRYEAGEEVPDDVEEELRRLYGDDLAEPDPGSE